jgi:hypothetical protein
MFVYERYFGGRTRLGQKEAVQCLCMNDIWEAGPVSFRRKLSNVCLCMKFRRLDPSRSEERCPIFVYERYLGGWIRLVQKKDVDSLFMYDIWEVGHISVRRKMSTVCSCTKFGRLDPPRSEERCPIFVYV